MLPVLRHLLYFIAAGSAKKEKILAEMQTNGRNLFILPGGVAEIFLSRRRRIEHDGSTHNIPSGTTQTIKARRYGLMKLALETGAIIYPSFVFGASDMLDQLAHVEEKGPSSVSKEDEDRSGNNNATIIDRIGNVMESLSRKVGGGLTLFYGKYYLPVPYNPRLTMVLGDPIYPVIGKDDTTITMRNFHGEKCTCVRVENPTKEQVEDLMDRYTESLHRLFEQYKADAGYPDDTLRII